MRKILLAAVTLGVFSVQAKAADPILFMGAGVLPCTTWGEDERTSDVSKNFEEDMVWVMGFLSGAEYISGVDVLKGNNLHAIQFSIDIYCENHPSDPIMNAVTSIYKFRAGFLSKEAAKQATCQDFLADEYGRGGNAAQSLGYDMNEGNRSRLDDSCQKLGPSTLLTVAITKASADEAKAGAHQ